LWIDTQGNDLNCLKSFGDKISVVKSGQCEVAGRTELYAGTGNTYQNCHKWLTENGFDVRGNPQHHDHEVDLYFTRKA
jgi:hypothetical protein